MGPIESAIQEFTRKRLGVYQADGDQLIRDTRGAERATTDHAGRWFFELLQNSDDATATEVHVEVDDATVYVADNGNGLKHQAVDAICGTDFSDKPAGMIGRKGVGFKSIYEVSRNPQVLTVAEEGIEFNPDKAKAWLRQNNLPVQDDRVPYQWIPFYLPWARACEDNPRLCDLGNYKTVVVLRGVPHNQVQRIEQLFREWPPHALFAFRHLRRITAPGLDVELRRDGDLWLLQDSREREHTEWRVSKHTEALPAELLETLLPDERRAIPCEGIGLLIAAPLAHENVVPTADYLPIHVFYPTEQPGPVRLLLHAEFLVKSDRTALIPVDNSAYNAWVAEKLAHQVVQFINNAYSEESPSSHASLLLPFGERESHWVADDLWRRISHRAKEHVRLGDIEAKQRLTVDEARLISVSVCSELARDMLEATSIREHILHRAFDNDEEARKALGALDCTVIHDQDILAVIGENAESLAGNIEWLWSCWRWLAAWVAETPHGEKRRKRIERTKELPLVPVGAGLMRASDLAGRIVTWMPNSGITNLPDWLPLTFVADWFRDRVLDKESKASTSVEELCNQLGIKEPGSDVTQRATSRAIEDYWHDKQGDPERFLHFILKQDWYEKTITSETLKRCPVPLSRPVHGHPAAEARTAYFGREWDNDLLADLYIGNNDVPWVKFIDGGVGTERSVLEWLGCSGVPRIIEDRAPRGSGIAESALPDTCSEWREKKFRNTDYRPPTVDAVARLEHLALHELDGSQICALLLILARHWDTYYKKRRGANLSWFYRTERSRQIDGFWWFEILHKIRPATRSGAFECTLGECWLPDKQTERAIGDLLAVIDLHAFGDDRDIVGNWLRTEAGLRSRIDQLTTAEWKNLLTVGIPVAAPADRLAAEEQLRDRVTRWYTACLETIAEKSDVRACELKSCPLICRKADSWQYQANEPRYLNDDNYLAKAFVRDVWLIDVPSRLAADAVKYFGVPRLSESVQVTVTPGEPKTSLPNVLLTKLDRSLPYVWALRCSQTKQATEKLSARLKALKIDVVPSLKANLSLNDVHHQVEKRSHVTGDTIYLHEHHASEAELAEALATMLDVRSEADFYENLLRCTSGHQQKEKLLRRGISDAELERCLREYESRSDGDDGPQMQSIGEEAEKNLGGTTYPSTSVSRSGGATIALGGTTTSPRSESPLTDGASVTTAKNSSKTAKSSDRDTDRTSCVTRSKGGRPFISYLGAHPEDEISDPDGLSHVHRMMLEAKAIDLILSVEPELARTPTGNQGFDLFEPDDDGHPIRWIEVKAMTGCLHDRPVGLSRAQFKCAEQHGESYWLYIVEHAGSQDARIVRIQNPVGKSRTYTFDHGWLDVAVITPDNLASEER